MPNIMGRDLMNNPKMRDEASRMAAEENILSCIKVSDKANATYTVKEKFVNKTQNFSQI